MNLLVTRPQPQADEWVNGLQEAGVTASALPLLAIAAPLNPAPVQAAWAQLAQTRLLMFVSPAAAQWFFHAQPPHAKWPAHALAACPGPGTATALLRLGAQAGLAIEHIVHPSAQASQFDSEQLWPLLAPMNWIGQQALVIGGGEQQAIQGRNWLGDRLRERGATVHSLVAYQRGPATWSPAEQALAQTALAQPERHVWLFSSSQAIELLTTHHLPQLGASAPNWARHQALVTHPKIAQTAHHAGFGHIVQTRPTLEAVAQARRLR